jgi:hypothetical protein
VLNDGSKREPELGAADPTADRASAADGGGASDELRARFPMAAEFLAALPAGIASYPACTSKISVLRERFASRSSPVPSGLLPSTVTDLLDELGWS